MHGNGKKNMVELLLINSKNLAVPVIGKGKSSQWMMITQDQSLKHLCIFTTKASFTKATDL